MSQSNCRTVQARASKPWSGPFAGAFGFGQPTFRARVVIHHTRNQTLRNSHHQTTTTSSSITASFGSSRSTPVYDPTRVISINPLPHRKATHIDLRKSIQRPCRSLRSSSLLRRWPSFVLLQHLTPHTSYSSRSFCDIF